MEEKNYLKVGDVLFPQLKVNFGKIECVAPIFIFKNHDDRCFTTCHLECITEYADGSTVPRNVKYCGQTLNKNPKGLKVFVNHKPGYLAENEAIRVTHVFAKSCVGEVVNIRLG